MFGLWQWYVGIKVEWCDLLTIILLIRKKRINTSWKGYHIMLCEYLQYVTFTTPDPVDYPVSSPTYSSIHAAFVKGCSFIWADQCIDKFYYRDLEDWKMLDSDDA